MEISASSSNQIPIDASCIVATSISTGVAENPSVGLSKSQRNVLCFLWLCVHEATRIWFKVELFLVARLLQYDPKLDCLLQLCVLE